MSMSVEMHNQGQDPSVHTCSECKQGMEVYWHCTECNDYNLCISCYDTKGHTHNMVKVGLGQEEGARGGDEGGNQGELLPRRPREPLGQSILRCIEALVHASRCSSASCQPSCQKMKRVLEHANSCPRRNNGGCPVCKQLIALCCYHAKQCRESPCPVPFCFHIKQSLRRQRLQLLQQRRQLLQQRLQLLQQRRRLRQQQRNGNDLPQG